MKNLVKMTRAEYTAAKAARTLVCPNTCLISDETQSVEFLYANPMVDVGITGLDGGVRKFYSYEEYDALEVKPIDPMTYLATATEILGILPNVNTSVKWSSEYKTVPGCFVNGNQVQALLDFGGKANSDAVLAYVESGQQSDCPAFTWAAQQVTSDGKVGFIPALGQLDVIATNQVAANRCRILLGQAPVCNDSNYWWSSSQYNYSSAWVRSSSAVSNASKNGSNRALAVCAL